MFNLTKTTKLKIRNEIGDRKTVPAYTRNRFSQNTIFVVSTPESVRGTEQIHNRDMNFLNYLLLFIFVQFEIYIVFS